MYSVQKMYIVETRKIRIKNDVIELDNTDHEDLKKKNVRQYNF